MVTRPLRVQGYETEIYAYSLTKNLAALTVLYDSSDLFWCGIRFDDLVLTFQSLLVLLPVLLLRCLVVLDRLYELGLDQPRL